MRTTEDVIAATRSQLLSRADERVRLDLGEFIREFNHREWTVRVSGRCSSFEQYVKNFYQEAHKDVFGYGFVVEGKPVPYFHPNRSFHDEIIWLNANLYYDASVSFVNKLLNSALVKFYGPSKTLEIITGRAGVPASTKTDSPYVDFERYDVDDDYAYTVTRNIELAKFHKARIWGTTELRTSLQTAASRYSKSNPSPIDRRGVPGVVEAGQSSRGGKMRSSDMIHWVASMRENLVSFYSKKPDMRSSFEKLTSYPGIGNYYGYHFSSNLCRMPGIGAADLIEAPTTRGQWSLLKKVDTVLTHGNLNENADYVVAGPGACRTLARLWPDLPINTKTAMKMILAIRDDQENFFGILSERDVKHLTEASELGRFTTFGVEIACCQYDVFDRVRTSLPMASNRAQAPISTEVRSSTQSSLISFFY